MYLLLVYVTHEWAWNFWGNIDTVGRPVGSQFTNIHDDYIAKGMGASIGAVNNVRIVDEVLGHCRGR